MSDEQEIEKSLQRQDRYVAEMVRKFPALAKHVDTTEGPHYNMGNLAIGIRDGRLPNEIVELAFQQFNTMGESGDADVLNLLIVSVLEILTDTDFAISAAREKLDGKALVLFEEVLKTMRIC